MPRHVWDDYEQWCVTEKRVALVVRWSVADIVLALCAVLVIGMYLASSRPAAAAEAKPDPVYFTVTIDLRSLTGQPVTFTTAEREWRDAADCEKHLPAVEAAVMHMIQIDPSLLRLFGQQAGKPTITYFVANASCDWAAAPGGPKAITNYP